MVALAAIMRKIVVIANARIGTCQQYETNLSFFLHPKFSPSFLRFICL